MKNIYLSCLFLTLFLHVSLVLAQSENCYFCNSEDHGEACHDPIDPNLIQTQRCSDFETDPNRSYYEELRDFFKRHYLLAGDGVTVRNTTISNVCFSMTYEFSSRNVSARGCEQDRKNTVSGVLDVCEYYRDLIPARITNFNCSICPGNLCNYKTPQGNDSNRVLSVKWILGLLLAKAVFY